MLSAILFCIVSIVLFTYVDRLVASYAQGELTRSDSGIYSSIETLVSLPIADATNALIEAGLQKKDSLVSPNDFSVSDNEILFLDENLKKHSYPRDPLIIPSHKIAHLTSNDEKESFYTPLSQIPDHLKNAFLAIEDRRFYEHFGVDFFGIGRAILLNLTRGGVVAGGSTITQQLAKNVFFSSSKTLSRKFLELFGALSLERHLSKDEILEKYCNEIYFGQAGSIAVHGVKAAARFFFNKDISQITLTEAALLAGLIQAPSAYNPFRHPERAKARRDVVLDALFSENLITKEELITAKSEPLKVVASQPDLRLAPYFVDATRRALSEFVNIDANLSLTIETGIRPSFQSCAENAIERELQSLEKRYPRLKRKKLQAALVSIEPFSGLVRSYVGGRDYSESQFDRASLAQRQIGSTIKPFIYLAALDGTLNHYKTATPISILTDEPITIDTPGTPPWSPENYDKNFRGDVTLRYALENSLNIPVIKVLQKIGVRTGAQVIEDFGIHQNPPKVPSLALGSIESTLIKLTEAYAALANNGLRVPTRLFNKVTDSKGTTILENPIKEYQLADENAVYVLTDILRGVVERGTAKGIRSAGYHGVLAGKTGTTNDARDAWFVGFSPTLSTGVWVGYDDNSPLGLTGGVAAAPIAAHYLKCIAPFTSDDNFIAPPGTILVDLDSTTYARADESTQTTIKEVFVAGTEP